VEVEQELQDQHQQGDQQELLVLIQYFQQLHQQAEEVEEQDQHLLQEYQVDQAEEVVDQI
jgi:hypothetical protein